METVQDSSRQHEVLRHVAALLRPFMQEESRDGYYKCDDEGKPLVERKYVPLSHADALALVRHWAGVQEKMDYFLHLQVGRSMIYQREFAGYRCSELVEFGLVTREEVDAIFEQVYAAANEAAGDDAPGFGQTASAEEGDANCTGPDAPDPCTSSIHGARRNLVCAREDAPADEVKADIEQTSAEASA